MTGNRVGQIGKIGMEAGYTKPADAKVVRQAGPSLHDSVSHGAESLVVGIGTSSGAMPSCIGMAHAVPFGPVAKVAAMLLEAPGTVLIAPAEPTGPAPFELGPHFGFWEHAHHQACRLAVLLAALAQAVLAARTHTR